MPMRILAKAVNGEAYIIGDGDPQTDPMMMAQHADVSDRGCIHPPVPLQTIFKWTGDWEDPTDPDDQALLKKLLALPKAK